MRSTRLLGILIVLAALAALGYFVLRPRLLAEDVQPVTVTRGEIVQTIVANGRAETPSGVDVASQIIGTVAKVTGDEGARVKAGDLLIQLDDNQARASVEQAEAALRQVELRLNQLVKLTLPVARETLSQSVARRLDARAQLDRALRLADRSVASGASVDQLQRAFEVADAQARAAQLSVESASPGGADSQLLEAALAEAKAKLRVSQAQLDLTRILSPIDGLVTMRDVEEGTVVQPGKTLMHLAPNLPKQLVVQIDERNLGLIALGQKALVSADAHPGQVFPAVVSHIDSTVDADRGSVEIKYALPEPPAFLRENMTVTVDLEVARHRDTLILPLEVVKDAAGENPTVIRLDGDKPVTVPVRLGLKGEGLVEVLSGLKEGDRVVPPAGSASASGELQGMMERAIEK
jgi:HlyD family secretion protein